MHVLMTNPTLYSLRHCPYAMRARLAILLAKQTVNLRAIVLKNKPAEMLVASPKGSVPVLVLTNGLVIDESLEIMQWVLNENDPDNLLYQHSEELASDMFSLINRNDTEFKDNLEKYKSAKRYHDNTEQQHREACEAFIHDLEKRLTKHPFFIADTPSLADYALLPFLRQFARVNRAWYIQAPYPLLRNWLDAHLQSRLFAKAMTLYPLWLDNHEDFLFGESD